MISVTAVFDIGKTNKKFFLFDENLDVVFEEYVSLVETADDDGFPCEDVEALSAWVKSTVSKHIAAGKYNLRALNFSTYGASFVHLGSDGRVVAPLYNYLKPYPQRTLDRFFAKYPEQENSLETASPNLTMLNSGLQLYWLKHDKPEIFRQIKHSLHLPQYLSFLFTGEMAAEPTSIGCHTRLWDFRQSQYHRWLQEENILRILPEPVSAKTHFEATIHGKKVQVGVGIHDSSSALASYLLRVQEPFLLISTGTWSITLNPFTEEGLTSDELERDCLHFLDIHGKPVKASRLFLGNEFQQQTERLAEAFHKNPDYFKSVKVDEAYLTKLLSGEVVCNYYPETIGNEALVEGLFPENRWEPAACDSFEHAYHQLNLGLARLQKASVLLARGNSGIRRIFLDGGFIHNELFLRLLAHELPGYEITPSEAPNASALGAAKVMG